MASHRPERIGERIRQELSVMFNRGVSDPRLANINVTRVEVTGDLRIAKVYIAPRPENETDDKETIKALAHASGFFRHQLAESMDLRYTPELRFYLDRSIALGEHFLQVLKQVENEERRPGSRKRRPKT